MKGIPKISSVLLCASSNSSNRDLSGTARSTSSILSSALLSSSSSSSSLKVPSLSLRTIKPIKPITTSSTKITTTHEATAIDMPIIGLGTYKFKKGSGDATRAIQEALQLGYRHIDTAFIYGGEQTEKEIGSTLAKIFADDTNEDDSSTTSTNNDNDGTSTNKRSDLFITSKQWRAYHGYESTLQCLDKSLKRLQTSYLDLYLIHWPGPAYNTMNRRKDLMEQSPSGPFVYAKDGHASHQLAHLRSETWRAMEDAVLSGKCRAIGVSNFTIQHLQTLKETARIWPPALNQIELHPYNPQTALVEYCRAEGIVLQAYASLGGQDAGKKTWKELGGRLLEREEVVRIAGVYGVTTAQVLLKWAMQQGFGVIPKSGNVDHLRLNLEAAVFGIGSCSDEQQQQQQQFDPTIGFSLSDEDMEVLNGLDQSHIQSEDIEEDGTQQQKQQQCTMIVNEKARLCWVRDPLKMLDFE